MGDSKRDWRRNNINTQIDWYIWNSEKYSVNKRGLCPECHSKSFPPTELVAQVCNLCPQESLRGEHDCQFKGFLVHKVSSDQPGPCDSQEPVSKHKTSSKHNPFSWNNALAFGQQTQSLFQKQCPSFYLFFLISHPHSESLSFMLLAWQLSFSEFHIQTHPHTGSCAMASPHCQVLPSHIASLIGDSIYQASQEASSSFPKHKPPDVFSFFDNSKKLLTCSVDCIRFSPIKLWCLREQGALAAVVLLPRA